MTIEVPLYRPGNEDAALEARLARLSPAKRALLEQRLRARSGGGDRPDPVLSFAQERMWLLGEVTPGLAAYNTSRVVRLRGAVDVERLNAALDTVLERHEVLRTRVTAQGDGTPSAGVAPAGTVDLEVTSRRDETEALTAVADFAARPFNLADDDLIRALLVRLDADTSILALSLHHTASDEASRGLLWQDLDAAYGGRALAPVRGQYSDFARAQRTEYEQGRLDADIDWWREHLADAPRVADLPADYSRPAIQSYRGARAKVALDTELVNRMRAYATAEGMTVFVVAVAAFSWLVSRWSRTDDVVLGLPVSGRERPEAQDVIGLFVNTVITRTDCSGEPSFADLVRRAHASMLASLAHQEVPFNKIVETLAPERDASRNPLFQMGANAITYEHAQAFALGDLTAEVVDFDPHTTKFDLALMVGQHPGGGIDLVLEYATDLFAARTIDDFLDELVLLLTRALAAPDDCLRSVSVLSPEQAQRLLTDVNATDAQFPDRCLHELISEQAARTPHAPAVADEAGVLTYLEFEQRTNALAHYLVGFGVGPDVPVGVSVRRSVAMEVAVVAVLKAGGAYVPLDSTYPADRLGYMLGDCGAAVLITERAVRDLLPDHPQTVLIEELDACLREQPTTPPVTTVTPDHLAYIIYTSGSTGRPKGVALQHHGVVNRLNWMQKTFQLSECDTVLQKTPLSFDVSVWEVLWPLMTGARLFLARPNGHRDVSYLHDVIVRERVTLLHFVPSMLAVFLEAATPGGHVNYSVRAVLCSGEALPEDVKEQVFTTLPGTQLHNLYGPTEASIDVTWTQCRPGRRHRVLIGAPIDNVQVYVLDEKQQPQPVGVPGELYLAGVQLARGYVGQPELTAQRFVPLDLAPDGRAYRTGDLVRWTSAGQLDYLGRIDGQVKLRGFRIELGEIESTLSAHPAVQQSCAVVAPGPSGEPLLIAYVVLRPDVAPADAETHVDEWNVVWEQTYVDSIAADPYFDISGWNSSFTSAPIDAADMEEWTQTTVDRIAALGASSVLDIGSGSGLLVCRLAGSLDRYVATDSSATAAERLRALAARPEHPYPSVSVRQAAAHDIDAGVVGEPVDLVVANSVFQYFPDAAYAADVVHRALAVLTPGGRVFVGDVRDLRLHEAFALRVESARSAPRSVAELRLRIEERCALDAELLLTPDFFRERAAGRHVQAQPKLGRADIEMNGYRFDVVVSADAPRSIARWSQFTSLIAIEEQLLEGSECGVLDIPDGRVASELSALAALAAGRLPSSTSVRQVPAIGVQPADMIALGERHGCHVELSVLARPGHFSAAFTRDTTPVVFPVAEGAGGADANDPAGAQHRRRVRAAAVTDLLGAAATTLPEYMVPSVVQVLQRLPLSPSGKLDRGSLPPVLDLGRDVDTTRSPQTPTEHVLADIFSQVLGVADVGVDENFFRLGGHSLLAVRLVAGIARDLNVRLALRTVFERPTVAGLAEEVDAAQGHSAATLVPVAKRASRRRARAALTSAGALAEAIAGKPVDGTVAEASDVTVFPLSAAQQRMWFLQQLDPDHATYTVRRAYRIRGTLDVERLRSCLHLLVERHDSLRTTVLERDGVLAALVADSGRWPLTEVDCSTADDPTKAMRADAGTRVADRFELSSGPLVTAVLYRLGTDDAVLVVRIHHIVVDGWSLDVLFGELVQSYAGVELADSGRSYADYVAWQDEQPDDVVHRQLDYWRQRMAGANTALELPTDHPHPTEPNSAGGKRSTHLGKPLTELVKSSARLHGTTPFTVLYALCAAVLGRLAGQDDVVLGTAVAGREHPDLQASVGLFANTLLLRTDLSAEPTVSELIRRCHDVLTQAQANQDVPFERLVEELRPERELGRNPLFQVMINMPPATSASLVLGAAVLEPFDLEGSFARFDLSLMFAERDGGLTATIEYRTELFEVSTIDALLARIRLSLEAATRGPELRVRDLPVLLPDEERQLLSAGTNLTAPPEQTVLDLIHGSVRATPDAVAVRGAEGDLTYAQLWRQSGVLAAEICGKAPGGSLVGLAVSRSSALVVAALAVWRAGCAYVPLDPDYPTERLNYMIESSGTSLVLRDEDVMTEGAAEPTDRAATVADLAYVIYTSGSTGRPKGVSIEHGALANLLLAMAEAPGFDATDTLVAVTTFSFDIAGLELFLPLVRGGTVVVAAREVATDPTLLAAALDDYGATKMQATPATWRMLVDGGWVGRPNFKAFCGGEPLTAELARDLLSRVSELWNCYGPTETTVWSTVERIEDPDDITIGRPIRNTTAYVLDSDGRLIPPGAHGELWIGGHGVAREYLNQPDLTAQRFTKDLRQPGLRMYRTGDVAAWTPDGRLRCYGRTDNQIKLRGHRIELGEIEAAMRTGPAVREAVAVLREDRTGDPRIIAYVTGTADGVLARLRDLLPSYMLPSAVLELDEMPRTLNGKTDRGRLPAPPTTAASGRAPETAAERAVAAIWSDLLGVPSVGVDDDFFALGGHSLLAIRLCALLSVEFGATVALRTVFTHPSLGALAAALAALDGVSGDQGPTASDRRGRRLTAGELDEPDQLAAALNGRSTSAGVLTVYPMSTAQQRMWLLHRIAPDDHRYNVSILRRLRGELDPTVLRAALVQLLSRHELLRTTYAQREDQLLQIVYPQAEPDVEVADLRGVAEDDVLARVRTAAHRRFDLEAGPALRVAMLRTGDEEWLLLLCAHHIALDGWSIEHLIAELAASYAGDALNPVRLQYGDYAVWEAARSHEDDRSYWMRQLAGAPSECTLPLRRPRNALAYAAPGRRIRHMLADDLSAEVIALAQRLQATPFMVLTAAVTALLARHGAGTDTVVGTPIAARSFAGSETLIGALINTLALRVQVDEQDTFAAHVGRVSAVCRDAYAHAEYPFHRVVADLNVERDSERHPLFQVFVSMQESRPAATSLGAAKMEPVLIDWQTVRYDAAWSFWTENGAIGLNFEHRTDLLEPRLADWVVARFETMLRAALGHPDAATGELPVIGEEEAVLLDGVRERRDDAAAALLPDLIAQQPRDAVAVDYITAPNLTYAGMELSAAALAADLADAGVRAGDRVALILGHGTDWPVAVNAVWRLGAAFVPVDPAYPPPRQQLMLADSSCVAAVIADDASPPALPIPVLRVGFHARDLSGLPIGVHPLTAQAPAYVIYTSGSTGTPKGSVITHGALAALTHGVATRIYGGTPPAGLRVSVNAPVSFDASMQQLLHLGFGATLVPIPEEIRLDPPAFVDYLVEHRVDVLDATPTHLRMLLDAGLLERPGGPTQLLVGGEAIDTELWRRLRGSSLRTWNMYGPTEVTVDSLVAELAEYVEPSIGRPLPAVSVRVVDDRDRTVPVGVAGELHLGGPQLAAGYLHRPELTAERFVETGGELWYRTGDRVRLRADGNLDYLGRTDDQVKIRGHRVEPGEIADALVALPTVDRAAVIAVDGELVAYAVPTAADGWDEAAVRAALRSELPAYLIPGRVVAVTRLPVLPNGKIDLGALRDMDVPAAPASAVREPPDGPVEEFIAEIWSDVLDMEEVDVHDDFFDLGGNSLDATRVITQLRSMGFELPVLVMFTHPTVRSLARLVETSLLSDIAEGAAE